MIGAIVLGLFAGYLARLFARGWAVSGGVPTMAVGVVGSLVDYLIFTEVLGIGDTDALDLGGLPGAVIGSVLVLVALRALCRPAAREARGAPPPPGSRASRAAPTQGSDPERSDPCFG